MGIRHALMMTLALAPSLALVLTAGAPAGEAAADLPAPAPVAAVAPDPAADPVLVPVRAPGAPVLVPVRAPGAPEPAPSPDPAAAPAPAPAPVPTPTPSPSPSPTPSPSPSPDPASAPVPAPTPAPAPASATEPAKPLYRLPTDQREVVLTIDDGPGTFTPALLKILAENRVPAVFFWIGGNKGLDLAKEVLKAGHQIGSHTWSHPVLTKLDASGQREQMARAQEALQKGAGAGIPYIRPPYGSQNADTLKIAAELKQTVVLWNVDSRDWALADHPEQIVPNVMAQVKPGSIILLHERAQTVQVLPDLIKQLKAAGYTFRLLPASS